MDDATFDAMAAAMDEPYREYWSALGRFIHEFSTVESALHALVYHYAGVKENVGKAIFHGLRIDNAKDTVNRLLEAKGDLATIERLTDTFGQLSAIATVRNNLVHWGARDTFSGLVVSNARVAFAPSRLKSYVVSADMLALMRADLFTIHIRFLGARFAKDGRSRNVFASVLADAEAATWQYKRPQQSPSPKPSGTRALRRSRKRQQDASQS